MNCKHQGWRMPCAACVDEDLLLIAETQKRFVNVISGLMDMLRESEDRRAALERRVAMLEAQMSVRTLRTTGPAAELVMPKDVGWQVD